MPIELTETLLIFPQSVGLVQALLHLQVGFPAKSYLFPGMKAAGFTFDISLNLTKRSAGEQKLQVDIQREYLMYFNV